ncbi:hypothetical protein P7K49_021864 [Saguinus oedipus]|uniref:Uncharacterized protein n=1 Tax=Saguinus oedipus TaxID=9490 RepID=A0ABQ9UTY5_SAGOE|nr:hypothetical protein P7K49_021864 [Saguinus oedipus]
MGDCGHPSGKGVMLANPIAQAKPGGPLDAEHGAWALGHKLCSIMVKQEQSPELPMDPLAAPSAMAAVATMATTPLLGLSPLSRLPIPHQWLKARKASPSLHHHRLTGSGVGGKYAGSFKTIPKTGSGTSQALPKQERTDYAQNSKPSHFPNCAE